MNCKPGDLAVVVRYVHHKENLGRVVRVIRPASIGDVVGGLRLTGASSHVWMVEGRIFMRLDDGSSREVARGFLGDAYLRPIRDPGDEAQDESKSWLPPVPNDITLEESELLREALTEWVKEKQ